MQNNSDKIDVELLLNDFRVKNKEALNVYLKELWKDLSQRSEDKVKGINRVTFSKVKFNFKFSFTSSPELLMTGFSMFLIQTRTTI